MSFLGHDISVNGIRKSEQFMEKIRDFRKPQNVTEMRQFLGLCNFQRKFIPDFAAMVKPFTSLTGGPKKKKNHQLNISTQWTTRRPDEVKCFIIPSGYISAIYIRPCIICRLYANKNRWPWNHYHDYCAEFCL